jgi:hypothetical protein
MTRRPAAVTQADIARALRAAKADGGWRVEIEPNGKIVIRADDTAPPTAPDDPGALFAHAPRFVP